ncbi:glucan biosynthesis protein G [Sulfitobacter sp. D35]|uniref:glucan biosynthesis protein n=1 Tax=Sulfitobacter sp. D35 TaxID=3083252 RepID=UPI00296ED8BF|nr:glucan biosynthesis protein G [Sulfitobacter sp. D35]MDW4499116.1 glucan biosynthesis protein G [Sulfitobacter sp. D35]
MIRREFLSTLAALALSPLSARAQEAGEPGLQLGASEPFDPQSVVERARAMAAEEYQPRPQIPESWVSLNYDQYRSIWFDSRNALWENTDTPQRVDVFPPGLYFPQAVALYSVEGGIAHEVKFDLGVFDRTDQFPEVEIDGTLGYSGLRLRAELEKPGVFQEYAVFQGASYFRGIGTGEIYGLSARGLALDTGEADGEEFPDFVAFWIERPEPEATSVVLHALLDSPSCTGAYRFDITPGDTLRMGISATIFARTELSRIGIAPLTSMFLFDETMRGRFSDFRPAVHDSDGLLIHTGFGEVLWRQLANPLTLQFSAFVDNNPRGFGLMQRPRKFSNYNDLEALYHKRPSAWITPQGDWGPGAVVLVEIPADKEIYDNIVCFWRPAEPVPAGGELSLRYTLDWGDAPSPTGDQPLRAVHTAIGGHFGGGIVAAIDFETSALVPEDLSRIELSLRASKESLTHQAVQRNPETNGPRITFTFDPGEEDLIEFRAQLRLDGAALSEVWLYRWTKS